MSRPAPAPAVRVSSDHLRRSLAGSRSRQSPGSAHQDQALDAHTRAAGNFSRTAKGYDRGVRFNIDGALRLAASFPLGEYPRLLDVGCGTGWAALSMAERFGCRHVTGVDPARGMLDVFAEKLGALEGMEVALREEDVVGMGVDDVWVENRVRRTSAEAYLERMRVVASHIFAEKLTPEQLAELLDAVGEGTRAASGLGDSSTSSRSSSPWGASRGEAGHGRPGQRPLGGSSRTAMASHPSPT